MKSGIQNFARLLPALLLAGGVAGCIEGDFLGDQSGEPVESPEGIWMGSGQFVGGGELVGLIQDGRYVIVQRINEQPVRFYGGEYEPDSTDTWSATQTRYTGGVADRNIQTTITASVTLNILAGNDRAILPLNYISELADREASLEIIADHWVSLESQTGGLLVTIDDIGTLSSTNSDGCFFNADVSVIDPQQNLYRIDELELSEALPGDCAEQDAEGATIEFAGGGYRGYAAFMDNNPDNSDFLWLIAANDERAFLHTFGRESAVGGGQNNNDDGIPGGGNDGIPPGAGPPPTDEDFE